MLCPPYKPNTSLGQRLICLYSFVFPSPQHNALHIAGIWLHLPVKEWKRAFQRMVLETSPVVQWLRIHLSKQGTQVRPLGWKDPLGRKWQFTPLFLPGKSHGQRSMTSVVHWIIKKNLMDKGAGRSRVRYDLVAEQQQQTYLQSRNRDTDIENKHMGTRGERGEWDELGDWYIYTIDTIYEIDN